MIHRHLSLQALQFCTFSPNIEWLKILISAKIGMIAGLVADQRSGLL